MDERDANGAEEALDDHEAFERTGAGHEMTTTPLEGVVRTEGDDADGTGVTYRVTVTAPTLDAAVEGETVADVVEEGWFETLELRLEDPHQVGRGLESIDPDVEHEGESVRVEMTFTSDRPGRAAENAKALIEYVEGTWLQGLIPGYDYREPARSLLDRATRNYDENESTP
jgi:hypothetical protein